MNKIEFILPIVADDCDNDIVEHLLIRYCMLPITYSLFDLNCFLIGEVRVRGSEERGIGYTCVTLKFSFSDVKLANFCEIRWGGTIINVET